MSETPEGAFTPFAHEELTKFYAEWPGGMDEVESALRGWRERVQKAEREVDELREALRRLYRGYVVTLENGRDRIITLGGDCDPVDRMEREDPLLHDMRALLSRIDGGGT
jgi:hypothetical protein